MTADGPSKLDEGRRHAGFRRRLLVAAACALALAAIGAFSMRRWIFEDQESSGTSLEDAAQAGTGRGSRGAEPLPASGRAGERASAEETAGELSGICSVFGFVAFEGGTGDRFAGAGATVVLRLADEPRSPVLAETTSDAAGHFELRGIPRRRLWVIAKAAGRGTVFAEVSRTLHELYPSRVGPIGFSLPSALTLEGVVRDAAGRGAAGASVRHEEWLSSPTASPIWNDLGPAVGAEVFADAQGRFRFGDLCVPPDGRIELIARRRGEAGSVSVAIPRAGNGGSEPGASVEIQLQPSAAVTGTVVNFEGRPIAGATIALGPAFATSESDGTFRLEVDPRDASRGGMVVASAPGHAWATVLWTPGASDPTGLRLELAPGSSIEGIARGRLGVGVGAALVLAEGRSFLSGAGADLPPHWSNVAERLHALETRRARADAEGRFVIPTLGGSRLLASAAAPDGAGFGSPESVDAPAFGVELWVPESSAGTASLGGRVVDAATRQPLRAFRASIHAAGRTLDLLRGEDGAFGVDCCPAGRVRLRIAPLSGTTFVPVERILDLRPGESLRDLQVEVGGVSTVTLVLELPAGLEAASGRLQLEPIDGDGLLEEPPVAEVDRNGRASFLEIPPGRYRVVITEGPWAPVRPTEVAVHPGEQGEWRVAVTLGRSVFVVVRARGGEETLAPYALELRDASGALVGARPEGKAREMAGGGLRLTVPEGSYTIAILRADQTLERRTLEVGAQDPAPVVFTLDAELR
ncbi:MAG: carboxypeptidase regulatory-like domain-containing protein [Planctomycetes bacterium]|nr:carboxypeptidase regulatory-like domain-containing protein [Planctomycetota bacterium]